MSTDDGNWSVYQGYVIELPDGRRVAVDEAIAEAKRPQGAEIRRLIGAGWRRTARTLATLVGPVFGWNRRQFDLDAMRTAATAASPVRAATEAATADRVLGLAATADFRSDGVIGHVAGTTAAEDERALGSGTAKPRPALAA
jgi:hypothetical protein